MHRISCCGLCLSERGGCGRSAGADRPGPHGHLGSAGRRGRAPAWTGPTAAQIEASIQHDGLISFIDGRSYKTLKRHLTAHGLTPERYRAKYGLPADYPMVAPGYAAKRSEIAKAIQLGHKAA